MAALGAALSHGDITPINDCYYGLKALLMFLRGCVSYKMPTRRGADLLIMSRLWYLSIPLTRAGAQWVVIRSVQLAGERYSMLVTDWTNMSRVTLPTIPRCCTNTRASTDTSGHRGGDSRHKGDQNSTRVIRASILFSRFLYFFLRARLEGLLVEIISLLPSLSAWMRGCN